MASKIKFIYIWKKTDLNVLLLKDSAFQAPKEDAKNDTRRSVQHWRPT